MRYLAVAVFALSIASTSFGQDAPTFIRAAAGGDLAVVKEYIKQGGDVNATAFGGATALVAASQEGQSDVVDFLLANGAQPNDDALMLASYRGHSLIVSKLLGRKCNPNAANSDGVTVLMHAAASGDLATVQLLLRQGVDVDVKSKTGLTAHGIAQKAQHIGVAKLIWALESGQRETIFGAIARGDREKVERLISQGADISSQGPDKATPLHLAAMLGHSGILADLVSAGAKADTKDRDGRTPLMEASSNGHKDVVAQLLRTGSAMIDAATSRSDKEDGAARTFAYTSIAKDEATQHGATGLFLATQAGHAEAVKLLLDAGANPSIVSQGGATPLYMACDHGHMAIARLLIEHKADVSAATKYGWPPLFAASQRGHVDVVKLLLQSGADVNATGQMLEVPQTVRGPGDMQMRPVKNVTALYIAALSGHADVVEFLLAKGARADVKASNGETPVDAASRIDSEEIKQLVEGRDREPAANATPAEVVERYLAATAKLDTTAANTFLSKDCKQDIVVEIKANANSGWRFDPKQSKVTLKGTANGTATVVANMVHDGGGTFMGLRREFSLIREDGNWRISSMTPPPATAGPGVQPLR